MSNFDFDKYNEIVSKISLFTDELKKQDEENYMSFKVQNTLCRIIQEANRVNTYIRHYKDKQGGCIVSVEVRGEISKKIIVNDNLKPLKEYDVIKPNHYKAGAFDVIAFCQHHELGFDVGNVVKYVTRAGKKEGNSELQDLNKAMEFLNRRIKFIKGE